ncbi:MAG: hypothetical protein JWR16_1898 [Nevskia sp.]|nr:hypothetical protein [Nevskia sp.]
MVLKASVRLHIATLALPLLALAACAGSGDGLDQNGNPIGTGSSGGGSGPVTADFQSIQDQVFTPICAQCHAGASAPEGMQLGEGVSYSMIVNVPSEEVPTLMRIKPGDPDNSYLVQKIEGLAAVGAQMPAGCPTTQPCLDQDTINLIRAWVSAGAPMATTPASTTVMK